MVATRPLTIYKMRVPEAIQNASLATKINLAIRVIVRPPRTEYDINDLDDVEVDDNLPSVPRMPIGFFNRRKEHIVGSFYPSYTYANEEIHSCVIYLHGNIGNQTEGVKYVKHLAPRGLSMFCFDFSGSGLSDGEFVTLGYNESEDVIDVINFLIEQMDISQFVLWGRSMGAATAVLAAPYHPNIKGVIVDSGYQDLDSLFRAMASKVPIPSAFLPFGIWFVKNEVWKMAHFDCNLVRPIDAAAKAETPVLFGHCYDDDFVPYDQGIALFEAFKGSDKAFITLEGGHNGRRSIRWLTKSVQFALRVCGLPYKNVDLENIAEEGIHAASYEDLISSSVK